MDLADNVRTNYLRDMETNNAIGPRPTNPNEISFDARCFVVTGTRTEYTVSRSAIHSGPANFGEDLAAAQKYAARTGREVMTSTVSIKTRISWR
jgi:hypothetical protein